MRTNGILMAISSLPSKYGIGDFGKSAYEFVDLIKRANIKIWQMLPLNPTGFGNSPYQSTCGFALDPIYIDLEQLEKEGLIKSLKPFNEKRKVVEYEKVRAHKDKYLNEAFEKQEDTKSPSFKKFIKENPWVIDYAHFTVLLKKNNYRDWYFWPKEERYAHYENKFDFSLYEKQILFIEWCQFIAFKQFLKLKKYANKAGIEIMGDIPFYVGTSSSDAWANQDEFLLDENDYPDGIAGVPPDYFSKDGQRWGNLLYDWKYMKDDGFTFWTNRIEIQAKLYDWIRIDHFRAFDTYWNIDPKCPTAIEGKWEHAFGDEFFNQFLSSHKDIKIVAEDLGDLFPSVLELRDKYNLPGMNVLEFSIFDSKSEMIENQVIYTGTHDNDTLVGWLDKLTEQEKELLKILLKKSGVKGRSQKEKMINTVFGSPCKIAILPIQDYLGLDSKARMNVPGTCGEQNWAFRLVNFNDFEKVIPYIKELNKKFDR